MFTELYPMVLEFLTATLSLMISEVKDLAR